MQLAALELKQLTSILSLQLPGYFINNVSQLNADSFVLRLWHPARAEARLLISASRGLCLTSYQHPFRETGAFLADLREKIVRTEVVSISQVDEERIVRMELKGREVSWVLLAEFFGGGNILVLDATGVIVDLLHPATLHDRKLQKGEPYLPPIKRGLDILRVSRQDFAPAGESSWAIAKWLGRTFALPRKYVEEILRRANLDFQAGARRLTSSDFDLLLQKTQEVLTLALDSRARGWVVLQNGEPYDAIPFLFKTLEGTGLQECSSFMEAVDRVLTAEIARGRREALVAPHRRKELELAKSLEEQARVRAELSERVKQAKAFATKLLEKAREGGYTVDLEVLQRLGAQVELTEAGRTLLQLAGLVLEVPEGISVNALASKVFDEAKKLDREIDAIEVAEKQLREKLEAFRRRRPPPVPPAPAVRRTKLWFERYRWFWTTRGLLAIGGRDSSSNSAIIRRHLEEKDLVFHADFYGSPFFVLKNAAQADATSLRQVAEAVVGYSRAWSEGVSSAEAYWVSPGQVKAAGPSGTYLPKGSFLITGKKNVIKDVHLRLGVGLARQEGGLLAVGGPEDAVKAGSLAFVTIAPDGHEKASLARTVKATLIPLLPEPLQQDAQRLVLDEFIRVLPSGRGRIVESGRGEQNR